MPYYTYECSNGHQQEEFHLMKESPIVKCKECKSKMLKSIVAPQFSMNNHPGSHIDEADWNA